MEIMSDKSNDTPIRPTVEEIPAFLINGKKVILILTTLFLIAVLFVFPIYYQDYYFDILRAKYQFYYISVLVMFAGVVITALVMLIVDIVQYNGRYTTAFLNRFSIKNIRNAITIPDIALICFLVVATLSTILSDFVFESFWGNEGRFTGLFLLLIYGISFFIISKLSTFKNWHLELFLVSSALVCAFGITDYFNLNILHFKDNIDPKQYNIFMSFMGNINTYTAYISLVLGVASVLFASDKKRWKCTWHFFCLVLALFAIVTGQSDNAYLAIIALFSILPFYMFKSWTGLRRYIVILASFFSVVQLIDVINQIMPDQVLEIQGIFSVLVNFSGLAYIVIALWMAVGVLYAQKYIRKKQEQDLGKWPRKVWGIIFIAGIIVLLFILFDANIAGNGERYGALRNYVVIDDEWGTHRGYIWRLGIRNYKEFSPIQKIIGYGPDTFGIITVKNNYNEMVSRYGEIFDSAHNEYLQYFITIGPLGLAAYLTLLISSGERMVRRASENPYVMATLFAMLCYGAQALVNINLPIATPVMWTMMMIGLSGCRSAAESGKKKNEDCNETQKELMAR